MDYALIGLLFFVLGAVSGWKMREVRNAAPRFSPPPDKETAKELERMKEQQEAFREIMNYSIEKVYGMDGGGERTERDVS